MTTIGILGAGQLGRMLALAGIPLGLQFRFLDPAPDSPSSRLAPQIMTGYADPDGLAQLAKETDVVTYEFENVPVDAARWVAEQTPVYPPPDALENAQDRLVEKRFFQSLGIPTPDFAPAEDTAVEYPAILKTRRMGYDGKGQFFLQDEQAMRAALAELDGDPAIIESFVRFEREVSIIAVRSQEGETRFYPLAENVHRAGILRRSIVGGSANPLQEVAEGFARAVLEALNYVGVLAIEFFEVDGQLLANEMAPRVHNSGHWTIEGAVTSQFENHVRAVAGLPLGSTSLVGASAMVNLIGAIPRIERILSIDGTHLHLYGKSPRPGRKLGHITLVEKDEESLHMKLTRIESELPHE